MGEFAASSRRRAWLILAAVLAMVILAVPVSIPIVNDAAASDVERRLMEIDVPAGAERIDSMAQAGKIVGNGNGMQYAGALLIRSEHSAADLQRFYSEQEGAVDLSITVTPADDLQREGLHGARGFLAQPGERGTFVVLAWGSGPGEFFEELDLRGH